jgi:hypothetical protein
VNGSSFAESPGLIESGAVLVHRRRRSWVEYHLAGRQTGDHVQRRPTAGVLVLVITYQELRPRSRRRDAGTA